MKTKGLLVRLDDQEHKQLKIFCVEHGVSMQDFITKAVREYQQKWVV